MFKSLVIERLRGIRELRLDELRRVNLLVGKNNSGKTTVLEAAFLLSGAANPELASRVNLFRGLHSPEDNSWRILFNDLDPQKGIRLSGVWDHPRQDRSVVIRPSQLIGMSVASSESKRVDSVTGDLARTAVSYSAPSVSIAGVTMEYTLSTPPKKKAVMYKSSLVVEGAQMKLDPPKNYREALIASFVSPNTYRADASQRFSDIQISKRSDELVDLLKKVEPSLLGLSLGADGLIYADSGLSRLKPVNAMGDGLFHLLDIFTAIFAVKGGVVLIDEIENGLYGSTQSLLWRSIVTFARDLDVQIFATTHSIECVKVFNETLLEMSPELDDAKLLRIERQDGATQAVSYTRELLQASLDEDWEVR